VGTWGLAPTLLNLFMLSQVPDFASLAPVTPIFRKGETNDTENYRPLAATEPILRLYANILNARVISLTEKCTLRAPSQAGSGLPYPLCTLFLPSSTSSNSPPVHTPLSIVIFSTSKLHTTMFIALCCGRSWGDLEFMVACLMPYNLFMLPPDWP